MTFTTAWRTALVAREGRDNVIAYLCAQLSTYPEREFAFRYWCRYHRESVLRSDLARLKEAHRNEQQSPLF